MKKINEYGCILFDLDNTILDFSKSEDYAIRKLMTLYNIQATDENVEKYVKINEKYWDFFSSGVMTKSEILRKRFKEFFGLFSIDVEGIDEDKKYRFFLTECVFLVNDAIEVLDSLKSSKKLYIVSNGVKETQMVRIKKAGIDKYFDGIFLSEEIGYSKPDVRYFDYVKKHIVNFDDQDTIVVGDNEDTDIMGGKNANLSTVLYIHHPNKRSNTNSDYQITSLKELL